MNGDGAVERLLGGVFGVAVALALLGGLLLLFQAYAGVVLMGCVGVAGWRLWRAQATGAVLRPRERSQAGRASGRCQRFSPNSTRSSASPSEGGSAASWSMCWRPNARAAGMGWLSTPPALHCVFLGNPGTGKTTVARLMGEILARPRLSRQRPYRRSRSRRARRRLRRPNGHQDARAPSRAALDGVLFIDEAYALAPPRTPATILAARRSIPSSS